MDLGGDDGQGPAECFLIDNPGAVSASEAPVRIVGGKKVTRPIERGTTGGGNGAAGNGVVHKLLPAPLRWEALLTGPSSVPSVIYAIAQLHRAGFLGQ